MGLDLVTLAEYKAHVGILNDTQDTLIKSLITKISGFVKNYCNRTFLDYVDDSKVEIFKTSTGGRILLKETPLLAVQSVEWSETYGKTYTTLTEFEDYVVDEELDSIQLVNPTYDSYNAINAFKITYTAGYEELPSELKLAVFDLITYYMRNDGIVHSTKPIGTSNTLVEYIDKGNLPRKIRIILDFYAAYYV